MQIENYNKFACSQPIPNEVIFTVIINLPISSISFHALVLHAGEHPQWILCESLILLLEKCDVLLEIKNNYTE